MTHRVIAALLAAAGGRIEVPVGVWEQLPTDPEITTWLAPGREPRYVWALATPDVQELRAEEEAAYAAWRADLGRQAAEELATTLLQEFRGLPLDLRFLSGIEYVLDVIRMAGRTPALPGGARSNAHTDRALPEEASLETPNLIPEGWIRP